MTAQGNLEVVLWVCDDLKVDAHTRFCAVLTAYSESDFNSDAVQYGKTFGIYQQNPRWWPTANQGALAQCVAFLEKFRGTGDPLLDCWAVQRWDAPDPAVDRAAFAASPETANYARRVPLISQIINERRLP